MTSVRTNEDEPLIRNNKGVYQLWKGSSLSKRLNFIGSITCILDTSINIVSSRSQLVNRFFESTIPYYISAAYYLLPSASLLIYELKNYCINHPNHQKHEVDNRAAELMNTLYEVDGFQEYLNTHPEVAAQMLNKITKMQNTGYLDRIDTFINIVYFTLRALHGAVLIIAANDLANKQTKEEFDDWSDFISTVINIAYMMTMLIHNNYQKHQTKKNPARLFSINTTSSDLLERKVDVRFDKILS